VDVASSGVRRGSVVLVCGEDDDAVLVDAHRVYAPITAVAVAVRVHHDLGESINPNQ
jgi:hypothetical protein